nr:thioredoxin-like protein [Quercus suber]
MSSSKVTSVTSSAHFKTITSSSTYTIVDFYADWCGPCKVISPIFETLATAESKPGRIVFAKVNVDNQSEVARTYGVSAMPTFLILKNGKVQETIRGANATALRTAVLSAAADAAKGPARASASFSSQGKTLGSSSGTGGAPSRAVAGSSMPDVGAMLSSPAQFSQGRGFLQMIVRFLGLYLTTLLSFDPEKSAQASPFAVGNQGPGAKAFKWSSVKCEMRMRLNNRLYHSTPCNMTRNLLGQMEDAFNWNIQFLVEFEYSLSFNLSVRLEGQLPLRIENLALLAGESERQDVGEDLARPRLHQDHESITSSNKSAKLALDRDFSVRVSR